MVGKYKVITLCGSTRFKKQFLEIVGIYNHIHEQETRVEVTIGWNPTIYPVDSNSINQRARWMYPSLSYREAGVVPCVFNGIPNVKLVLFEKQIIINEIQRTCHP